MHTPTITLTPLAQSLTPTPLAYLGFRVLFCEGMTISNTNVVHQEIEELERLSRLNVFAFDGGRGIMRWGTSRHFFKTGIPQ